MTEKHVYLAEPVASQRLGPRVAFVQYMLALISCAEVSMTRNIPAEDLIDTCLEVGIAPAPDSPQAAARALFSVGPELLRILRAPREDEEYACDCWCRAVEDGDPPRAAVWLQAMGVWPRG